MRILSISYINKDDRKEVSGLMQLIQGVDTQRSPGTEAFLLLSLLCSDTYPTQSSRVVSLLGVCSPQSPGVTPTHRSELRQGVTTLKALRDPRT